MVDIKNKLYKICKYDNSNAHIVISLKGPDKYFSFLNKSTKNLLLYLIFFSNLIFIPYKVNSFS